MNFYEKARVTNSQRFPEYNGKTGVVLGISEEDGKNYGYDVHFPEEEEGYFFLPEELEGTGEFADPRDFYDENARTRVRVIDGEGFIIEQGLRRAKSCLTHSDGEWISALSRPDAVAGCLAAAAPTNQHVIMRGELMADEKALVSLSDHELRILDNAFNEVVRGLRGVEEFERSSGKTGK